MLKKLMISIFAIALGTVVVEATDLVTLELYFAGEGITVEGKLPPGVFRTPAKECQGTYKVMCPYFINVDKTQSVELKFKVKGDGKFSPALFAFRHEDGKKNQAIPVTCKSFEVDGEPAGNVPCSLEQWKRIMAKVVSDGDVVTIKLEIEKAKE